ncbi:MAG: PAS domain S-box protein [Bacteroidetes bacterium]|nr:PAS domain S-box protein [Bacteroidota bacterium]
MKSKNLSPMIENGQYRILFESNPYPMWIYDLESLKFLEVNDAAVEKYGYSKNEFYELTLKDIRPEKDVKLLLDNVKNETSKYQWSSGWRHKKKDGSVIDVEIISHNILHNGIKGRIVTVNDVTEKKRTEENFKLVIESSPNAIVLTNQQGIITLVNRKTETLFGYSRNELIGQKLNILLPERFKNTHIKHENNFFKDPKPRKISERKELYGLHKNGSEIPVEIGLNPIKNEEGISVLASIIDITERKLAQEELIKAEKRYRTTLDHMMEGFQIISNDCRYLYINNTAAEQGRKAKEDLISHRMIDVYPGIEKTEMFSELCKCMKNKIPFTMENEFIYPNGEKNWFLLNMEPVPEGVLILSKDITHEKKSEEELKLYREHLEELVKHRTAQLDDANKELESFSYSVSHDLRAPLRHITGFVQLLQQNISSSLDDKNKKYFSYITESTKKMGLLIDDLLSFSRMARTEMNENKVNLNNIIHEAIHDLNDELQERKIVWKIDEMPVVYGDASMLKQAYVNLISNAVKYTKKKDEAIIEISVKPDKHEYIFSVKDNGAGFDMKYADKLFGVFQRLHSESEFEGTGIGLANVKRIINRHDGKVWAEGEVNKGAAFYFTLKKNGKQS